MSSAPGTRPDIPMMPMPVYPSNPGFMQAAENPHINKVPVPAARGLHTGHLAPTTATPQEPVQHISSAAQNKASSEQGASDSTEGKTIPEHEV